MTVFTIIAATGTSLAGRGAPSGLAQEEPVRESPTQAWIVDWVGFLSEILPVVLVVAVVIVGIALVFKAQAGLVRVLVFGVSAALLFLFVTNVETVADFLREELPFQR